MIAAVSSLFILIFFDQTRLQPWVYQYLLLLVVLASHNWQREDEFGSNQTLGLVQFLIAGLYFWSGVQKLNFSFSHETLPILLTPLQNRFPSTSLPFVWLGVGMALIEAFIGCGLLWGRTRNLSVCLAVAMHLSILGLLIAKDYNSIVWVWNATLMLLVIAAFWKSGVSVKQTIQEVENRKSIIAKLIVAASLLLPVLSFWGWWDMYLSGALYSGNVEIGVIRVNEEIIEKLPPKAQQSVFKTKSSGEKMLPLFEWAIAELNVPVYPEQRVFKEVFRDVCGLADDKNGIELIIKGKPAILDGRYQIARMSCAEIENR